MSVKQCHYQSQMKFIVSVLCRRFALFEVKEEKRYSTHTISYTYSPIIYQILNSLVLFFIEVSWDPCSLSDIIRNIFYNDKLFHIIKYNL